MIDAIPFLPGRKIENPVSVNASEEFLGQRDDDARRASHVAESVLVEPRRDRYRRG
jgi:hypothetical protein